MTPTTGRSPATGCSIECSRIPRTRWGRARGCGASSTTCCITGTRTSTGSTPTCRCRRGGRLAPNPSLAAAIPVAAHLHLAAVRVPGDQEPRRERHASLDPRAGRGTTIAPELDAPTVLVRVVLGKLVSRGVGGGHSPDVQPVVGCDRVLRGLRPGLVGLHPGDDLPTRGLRRRVPRCRTPMCPRRGQDFVAHQLRTTVNIASSGAGRRTHVPLDRGRARSSDRTPPCARPPAHDLPAVGGKIPPRLRGPTA